MTSMRIVKVVAALALLLICTRTSIVASDQPLLYVATAVDGLDVVEVYDTTKPTQGPINQLKGLTSWSNGMIADSAGKLYVSQGNIDQPAVIFKPGHRLPSMTLSNPNWPASSQAAPYSIAVGPDGSVYVVIQGSNRSGILVYAPGKQAPTTFLQYDTPEGTPWCIPTGIAVDTKKDVYMGCGGYTLANAVGSRATGHVIEFAAGSTTGVDTGITVAAETISSRASALGFGGYTNDIQIDSKGNILVLFGAPAQASAVFVYPPGGSRRPSRVISLGAENASGSGGSSFALRLDANDAHLFVEHAFANASQGGVVDEYNYSNGKLVATFTCKTSPLGIAVSPPAPIGL